MYWSLASKHIPTALPKGDSLVNSIDDEFIEKPEPLDQIRPDLPARLRDLVMACVQVKPQDRPANMTRVADRLDLIHAQLTASESLQDADFADDDEEEQHADARSRD